MFQDLFFIVLGFELVCYLISMATLCCTRVEHKQAAMLLLFKTSLPLTLMLLSGVVLLSAAAGSSDLDSIQRSLERIGPEAGLVLNHSLPFLGIVLIVAGAAFRMGTIPVQFRLREFLKELPCWQITLSTLISVCAGAFFLLLFLNSIAVINLSYAEQVLFFLSLIVLSVTSGLLLIEKDLKLVLVLLVIQMTGIFFAQLSAVCWKWRHESLGADSISILDVMQESAPEYLFSYLVIFALACLLDSMGGRRAEIRYAEQLQGLLSDQRLLAAAAVLLLAVLMGVPGFSIFQMKWQTMQSLFEIHQGTSAETMAVVHAGYVGLTVLLVFSSAIVAFLGGKLIMQICFARPLTRHRQIPDKSMAFICYGCVIGLLMFNLRWIMEL
ncbi:MAG: hypothetical protein KDA77_10065 [Planctomycetaceae bacterium]|nr:hypothetical protein [Planctomycetaceae bacterium]